VKVLLAIAPEDDCTEASRLAATVAAFESVKSSFVWDEQRQQRARFAA
jgi:hypothetical protein